VNSVQIRSAIPEIFHTQTKTTERQNRTLRSSLRAVKSVAAFSRPKF